MDPLKVLDYVEDSDEFCDIHHQKKVKIGNVPPFCPTCQREEMERKEAEMVKIGEERYRRRRTIETLTKDSLVGDELLWDANFKNYIPDNQETTSALKRARIIAGEYLDPQKRFNTLLTGLPGAGKSHLAMSILKAVNDNANPMMSCLFISTVELLRLIKDSISNKESKYTEENMIRLLTKADLLVLDDLGSESSLKAESSESSEFNQRVLYAILNARSRTIITTNLNSKQMNEIYNPKLVSRIHRGVEGKIIKFTEATKDKRSKITY
ncbi:ATP-binding protein [Enterococcus asini]|uniref:ATP-binding protein n=1 Tax=Enterococcus asini TaxID=57732 RepID=UPI0022E08E67|nr:ATP-binding protein [Enterococcus asini]